ncbi:MAG: DEAD/DEAH box helicase [Collinsella sp.]|nr:DEAD/DEAH box helicase [Collinsella sp.]
MEWLCSKNELLLKVSDTATQRVAADFVWENAQGNVELNLPPLNSIEIRCSKRPLTPLIKLEESASTSFGVIHLYARNLQGKIFPIELPHKSDHALIKNTWHSFDYRYQEIEGTLNSLGVTLGVDLTISQYISCLKELETKDYFECLYRVSADLVSTEALSLCDSIEETVCHFTGSLFEYQAVGSAWLNFMRKQCPGMILGDGMGLGKTIQVVKVICDQLNENPSAKILIICPSALMENWSREIDKFSNGITKQKHSGQARSYDFRNLKKTNVTITTYDTAKNDRTVLDQIEWDIVVLDEAQAIKNPTSQRSKQIKLIPRKLGIAVTGTPFENHMTDIWSLIDFCIPGLLGSQNEFNSRFSDDDESASLLGSMIAPLLLRRTLDDVPNDLPDLIAIPMPIELEAAEAKRYEELRQQYTTSGFALAAINKLIASLAAPKTRDEGVSDLKYEYLDTVVDEITSVNEKMIVFADKLVAIEAMRSRYGKKTSVYTLTGEDKPDERQRIVDDFSTIKGSALLVVNPKVGGEGLNIVEANHVFHFSPQWNPAVIDQADARAHRRGQKKKVITHYPYYANTVEEYMWQKVYLKRDLAEQVVVGSDGTIKANEIAEALTISPI